MPANQAVKHGLALIESDPSKVLGLVVGKHNPKPGDYIPKAGELFQNSAGDENIN